MDTPYLATAGTSQKTPLAEVNTFERKKLQAKHDGAVPNPIGSRSQHRSTTSASATTKRSISRRTGSLLPVGLRDGSDPHS